MRRIVAARFLAAIVATSLVAAACGTASSPAPASGVPASGGASSAPATGAPASGGTSSAPATSGPASAPASSAAASSGASAAAASGPVADTIRTIGPEPTQGLDPAIAAADASRGPIDLMFDTLVAPQDESGKLQGDLAESWDQSTDAKTYTFHLRPGIKFSDGSPITADDVVFSINRMKGGEIMKGTLANVTSVTATDPQTVTVTLSEPSGALAVTLSRPGSAAILPMKAVQSKPDYFSMPDPVSGPYVLKSLTPKDRAVFAANPNYWKTGYPKTPNLVQVFSEDQNSWAAAVESDAIDIAAVGYADAQRLKSEGKIPVLQNDQLAPLFWGWNWQKAPFDNNDVRKAFAYAFDRQGRIDACWFGTGAVTYGNILRPWDPNYIEIDTYKMDRDAALQKAGQLLDGAGWKVGPDGIRVSTGVAGMPDGTKFSVQVPYEGNWPAAECNTLLLQSTMKKVGVDIQPQKYDPAAFWGDVAADKFTMYHGGAGATGAEDLYLDWFHTGGGLTPLTTHLKNPDIDKQIDQAVAAPSPDAAKQIYQSLEKWQSDFLPMMVTGYQWIQLAVNPKLQGYFQTPGGYTKWGLINSVVSQ